MNILFLTMNVFTDIEMHNIYSDLMKAFIAHGHRPYIVTPREKKSGEQTELFHYKQYELLKVRIGNTSNVSLAEKGISTVFLSSQYYRAVKRYLGDIHYGLILYSTPPITLSKPVKKLKRYFKCRTYLMLKDIFPQNAVDLEMFGSKSMIYYYFRRQEKELYKISDRIGCMSEANVEYVFKHNPEVRKRDETAKKQTGKGILEVCPNSIKPIDISITPEERRRIRDRYLIPQNKTVFVYGGNLGKPQGIGYMLKCMHSQRNNKNAYFLIVGNGTEYGRIQRYIEKFQPENIALCQWIPKEEYDKLISACDVGMIFLDYRFTIPNFPSRLLSYMEAKLPVLVCSDPNTDIGEVVVNGEFGWWCESDDTKKFEKYINKINTTSIKNMGEKSVEYLMKKFRSEETYRIIMDE